VRTASTWRIIDHQDGQDGGVDEAIPLRICSGTAAAYRATGDVDEREGHAVRAAEKGSTR